MTSIAAKRDGTLIIVNIYQLPDTNTDTSLFYMTSPTYWPGLVTTLRMMES